MLARIKIPQGLERSMQQIHRPITMVEPRDELMVSIDPIDDASKTARDQAMRAGNSIEQMSGGNTGNVDPSATTGSEGGGGNNQVGTVSSPKKRLQV